MKFLATLTLLAVTTSTAFAAERAIYDLQYLPKTGTTYGFTEAEYIKRDFSGKKGAVDNEITGYGFTQTIGHSFTDRFSVEASIGYGNFELDPDEGRKTEQTGETDPTISAKYRLREDNFIWDIGAGALISLGDSEIERNGDTDNLQGGNAVFIATQLGQKSETFQWAIAGVLTRNLERTWEQGNAKADIDGNNELLVRADFLNKLAEKSFVRYFGSIDFVDKLKSDDTDTETVDAPSTTYTIGGEYQHLFSQDFLGSVGVDYNRNYSNTKYSDSDSAWVLRLAANYQF